MADETKTVAKPPSAGDFSSFLSKTGIPSAEEVEKRETELFEKHKAAREPLLKQSDELMKKMGELNERMLKIPVPKAPALADLPEQPSGERQNPMLSLGGLAMVLAVVGSLKTRAPLTSALNSAAASMRGFHEGEKERAALERQKWRDNLEKGLRQNQIEMEKYTAALQEYNFDITKAQAAFRVIAAEDQHIQMQAAIESGDYKSQIEIINAGIGAGMKAAQIHSTEEYRKALLEQRASKQKEKEKLSAKAGERAVAIIDEMQNLLQTSTGITGAAGMVRRPMESVKSFFGGDEGKAHKYESLARELQNMLRQTEEFHYKGRTLSKEVADRDVIVRGLKIGDTDEISSDQLNHLRNMLTGGGTGFEPEGGLQKAPVIEKTLNGVTYEKIDGQWYPKKDK